MLRISRNGWTASFISGNCGTTLPKRSCSVASPDKVIEIFGEGKTDIGKVTDPEVPKTGVVAVLLHTLCGRPANMRVKRKAGSFLIGKGWTQKVKFAKRQAFYNKS